MSTIHLTPMLQCLRTRGCAKAVFALSLIAPVSAPALAQNEAGAQQQGQSNPMVGSWEMVQRLQNGSILHQFDQFGTDGTWRQTTISVGGQGNGLRTQLWGKYSVQSAGNNLAITFHPAGFAPVQACTPGVGCQQMPGYPQVFVNHYLLIDNNHLRSNDQQHLVTGRVAQIPQELMDQLPPTRTFAGAPPTSTGGNSSGYTPMPRPAGVGGTCDNLQQARICNLNDGHLYTDERGCRVCASGAGR